MICNWTGVAGAREEFPEIRYRNYHFNEPHLIANNCIICWIAYTTQNFSPNTVLELPLIYHPE